MIAPIKKTCFMGMVIFFSFPVYGEREDLSNFPKLRNQIQKKFEDINEFRQRLHRWEKSTRGFRRDHNFSLDLAQNTGKWIGYIPGQEEFEGTYYPVDLQSTRSILRASYSFHMQIYRGFGYYLGTNMGVALTDSPASGQQFKAPILYELPGVNLGFVWNVSPVIRIAFAEHLHLVRIDRFYFNGSKIQTTSRAFNRLFSIDIFLAISSGLRIEFSQYSLTVDDADFVSLSRDEKGVTFGWIHHLI